MIDNFKNHLVRQRVFSDATFGPGIKTQGILDHLEKEVAEVRKEFVKLLVAQNDKTDEMFLGDIKVLIAKEFVDLVILSFDGLGRAITSVDEQMTKDEVAEVMILMLKEKQEKNERRNWPDWRTADPNKAIEHIKGHED